MLYLVHRVTISIKLRPVKLQQAVSESLPHKGLHTELLGVQLTCLDPVPASIRTRNAQEINITNCDVTTWSWVNLVHPVFQQCTVMKHGLDYSSFRCPTKKWGVCACANSRYQALFRGLGTRLAQKSIRTGG